jgi:hypothetical protein
MGFPRKVEVKGFRHTSASDAAAPAPPGGADDGALQTAAPAPGAAAGRLSATAQRAKHVKASDMVETLNSKCPLKWACSELYPATSSYTAAFGSNPGRSVQVGYACLFEFGVSNFTLYTLH